MSERAIVIALGGNALAPAREKGTVAEQFRHARESLGAVVDLASQGWRIALVHGNGPQVGDFLVQQEMAREAVPPLPLGVLVAATQGWIGYMLQQSLQNALALAGVQRQVVAVVTQVLVDPADPALLAPEKPIGRSLSEAEASRMRDERGWNVAPVGSAWRRVVASPRPLRIVESAMVRTLVAEGHLVIAAGGGGTPVYRDGEKGLEGVDAVVDKDRAAAALATDIGASHLLILTDVEGVFTGYGRPGARLLPRLTSSEAEALLASGQLASGSMAPKVEAAVHFLRRGGQRAVIGRLDQGRAAVEGSAGTEIVPDESGPPGAAGNEPQGVE